MSDDRPLPYPDRDSEPYWNALSKGEFKLQRCDDCDAFRWPPRAICNRCHSFRASWSSLSGRGRILSWTCTHQAFAPAYRDAVPYIVVQVQLAEQDDILMIGGWRADREPMANEAVRVHLAKRNDDFTLPDWEPESELYSRS